MKLTTPAGFLPPIARQMGRAWYEDEGKLLTKRNTFNDFVDCAEHLIGG